MFGQSLSLVDYKFLGAYTKHVDLASDHRVPYGVYRRSWQNLNPRIWGVEVVPHTQLTQGMIQECTFTSI
jgi:hypothetical protein